MSPRRFSLLTYNVGLLRVPVARFNPIPHVEERLAVLPSEIARADADVVALQEVFSARDRDALHAGVRQRYPHIGHVRPAGLRLDGGQVTLSRFPLRARFELFRYAPFSERFYMKGALVTEVEIPEVGHVTVVNLHATAGGLLAMPESPRAEAMRARQFDGVLDAVRSLRGPLLLTGDFNAGPGVAERNYQQIVAAGFVDVHGHLQPDDPSCTWDPRNPLNVGGLHARCPPQRIDHVFVRRDDLATGRVRPRGSRIVMREAVVAVGGRHPVTPSDHYGLHVELDLAASSR